MTWRASWRPRLPNKRQKPRKVPGQRSNSFSEILGFLKLSHVPLTVKLLFREWLSVSACKVFEWWNQLHWWGFVRTHSALWAPVGCLCGLRCFTVRTRVIVDVDNKTSRSRNFFVYTIKKWFLIRRFIYQKKTCLCSCLIFTFYVTIMPISVETCLVAGHWKVRR